MSGDSAVAVPSATATPSATNDSASLLDFMLLVGRLKTTKRTGWVLRNVALPESIADHMYRMSLLALVISDAGERDHAVKLALAHDLAEAIVGDLTPVCGVSKEEKFRREESAMVDIRDGCLRGNPAGAELYALWSEYEANETRAAILMKDIDKFEMIVSASEYETAQPSLDLSEFFESTRGKFRTPQIKSLVEELYRRREALQNSLAST
jgi:putative hydrolases of HD superfamily